MTLPWLVWFVGAGCNLVYSDTGAFVFTAELSAAPGSPYVLSNSWICPTEVEAGTDMLLEAAGVDRPSLEGCVQTTLRGDAWWEGGCLNFDAAGEAVWEVEPIPCAAWPEGALAPGAFTFPIAPAAEVTARLDEAGAWFAESSLTPLEGTEWPVDWQLEPGGPVRVVSEQAVPLLVSLHHRGESVAWSPSQATLQVDTLEGVPPSLTLSTDGTLTVLTEGSSRAAVTMTVDGEVWDLGVVESVPVAALASIEVVVAYDGTDVSHMPFGARAIGRTEDGYPTMGVPVTWTYEGASMLQISAVPLWTQDLVSFEGACAETLEDWEPGPYAGTLKATVGELSGTASMAWTRRCEAPVEPDPVETPEGPSLPDGASKVGVGPQVEPRLCGCASPGGPASGLWVLGVLLARRRRRSVT